MRFRDRTDAGRQLAARLEHLRGPSTVVLGLPRGGVPVAAEVATHLGAPLDVILVRKLGTPAQPELAMGAIGEDGVRVLDPETVRLAVRSPDELARVEAREREELERRARQYRAGRPAVPLTQRTAVVVDDGIATGSTARAALEVARAHGAARVVLAVPVAPPETVAALGAVADEVVAVQTPRALHAVGAWYEDFSQVPDADVVRLLDRGADAGAPGGDGGGAPGAARSSEVVVTDGAARLLGDLDVPARASGLVVFAHGSGSSRHSSRNRMVASVLREHGLGTFLLDLLTPEEAGDRRQVFDVARLAARVTRAVARLRDEHGLGALAVGLFGASTGAAAALVAAADDRSIGAVVSRGGRPDLAAPRLGDVRAPTLLIVGSRDSTVLDLNRAAAAELTAPHVIEVVPGASHLFEEAGALEAVAELAAGWFTRHLEPGSATGTHP